MLPEVGKQCLSCKMPNAVSAKKCSFCGALLEASQVQSSTTNHMQVAREGPPRPNTGALNLKARNITFKGIGLFLPDVIEPFSIQTAQEFIIGRQAETPTGDFVNLMSFDAFSMGVSRRHLKIQKTEAGYFITDLGSTNGTWLIEKRLMPNRAYPLPNKAFIRLGMMELYLLYHED